MRRALYHNGIDAQNFAWHQLQSLLIGDLEKWIVYRKLRDRWWKSMVLWDHWWIVGASFGSLMNSRCILWITDGIFGGSIRLSCFLVFRISADRRQTSECICEDLSPQSNHCIMTCCFHKPFLSESQTPKAPNLERKGTYMRLHAD